MFLAGFPLTQIFVSRVSGEESRTGGMTGFREIGPPSQLTAPGRTAEVSRTGAIAPRAASRPWRELSSGSRQADTHFGIHGGRSPMSAVARREHSCRLIDQKSSHVAQYASTGWPSLSSFSKSPRMYPSWGRWCLHLGHVARKGIASCMRASACAVSVSGT